jgi:SAM-dependent MidA family methyltransferase
LSLEARLRERIQREGPISFYEWVKSALYDERDGYYSAARVRQGREGDYRTAPETSPLFAATFADYFAKLFAELGCPEQFTIVEVGAGSGDFAQGVLATLKAEHPEVFEATRYVVEEFTEASRERSAERLSDFSDRVSVRTPSRADADMIRGVIFSNELIDAFPLNRVVMRDGRLRQLFVGVDNSQFVWIESDLEEPIADYCKRIDLNLGEGQIAEINLEAEAFITRAAASLERGYVVTVDYGAERSELLNSPKRQQGTLRAFRRHQFADDVLANPGQQDLTTTIDWTQLNEAGEREGLRTRHFDRLDQFLISQGLLDRIAAIAAATTDPAEAIQLTTSARDLILPDGMAASFQVLVQQK